MASRDQPQKPVLRSIERLIVPARAWATCDELSDRVAAQDDVENLGIVENSSSSSEVIMSFAWPKAPSEGSAPVPAALAAMPGGARDGGHEMRISASMTKTMVRMRKPTAEGL
jgi:hypothetical protein